MSNISLKQPSFPLPSRERQTPFSLWAAFDKAWFALKGYHADEFRFVAGETPISTLWETAAIIFCYLIIIFGGRELMRSRKPFQFNTLFKIHNFVLTVISGALLALFVEQLAPTLWRDGFYENICGADGWTDPLVTLYYLNYLTKYIELIDTAFLMLKKKPLTFLHCYHHPATALLCYTQLVGRTSVSWVPITLNLTVHVVMYWYYFQSARGIKIWWKQYITILQIAQFIIDLAGVVYFASWDYWASTHFSWLPHVGTCAGHPYAAMSGCFILSSYLVLFVMFYFSTYKKPASKKSANEKPANKQLSKKDMDVKVIKGVKDIKRVQPTL
ncbi:fatty acid elongase 3 [Geosmithia morbida]|uniref:Elongation of fatty acids protein n=1 Tax=Geosmithia morbida TaxID=1094350 RepID=A0A9P4YVS1_9HYPO|nr:fatty acid elongase 3 [Geosmithia morbida]KAF4122935.1 fatty acid elongase 3 [Geosmithia morbida]